MDSLDRQVKYLSKELHCSVTLELVSPHLRICHVGVPWCGRQLRWQVLLYVSHHVAPDILFDDDAFRPLCGPPLHLDPCQPEPGKQVISLTASLHALLRNWPSPVTLPLDNMNQPSSSVPSFNATATSGAAALPSASEPVGDHQLVRLISLLLEAYREHQRMRLAAAVGLVPRLQFELSTLELSPGVQLELQQRQACFSLPLPPLNVTRLSELADHLGVSLTRKHPLHPHLQHSEEHPRPPPQSQMQQTRHPHEHPSDNQFLNPEPPAPGGVQPPGEGGIGGSGGDIPAHGYLPASNELPVQTRHLASLPSAVPEDDEEQRMAGFRLLAMFRLPTGATPAGVDLDSNLDLGYPELSLQLPLVLQELSAFDSSAGAAGGVTGTGAGGGEKYRVGGISAASGAGTGSASTIIPPQNATTGIAPTGGGVDSGGGGGVSRGGCGAPPFLPSFVLPLWTPNMCLAEYVPLAAERLQAQLDAHCGILRARQQFLKQLCELLDAPLELNLRAGAALFSVSWEGAPVLLSLELGSRFPTEQPIVVLQAVRVLPGADASCTYRAYPWSPRWSPEEMAVRIHSWLKKELPLFTQGRVEGVRS